MINKRTFKIVLAFIIISFLSVTAINAEIIDLRDFGNDVGWQFDTGYQDWYIYYPADSARDYQLWHASWLGATMNDVPLQARNSVSNPDPFRKSDLDGTYNIKLVDNLVNQSVAEFHHSKEKDGSGNFLYYQPDSGEGNPNNKWPYNRPSLAYTPKSFEAYDLASGTDAWIAPTEGGTKPGIYVSDPAQVDPANLKDYLVNYNGTEYEVYEVTGWTENNGEWEAQIGSTPITTFAPNADATFEGITVNITDGNETPVASGDKFLIRGRGIVSDFDTYIVFTVDTPVYPNQLIGGTDLAFSDIKYTMRTYQFGAAYLDSTIIYDMEFINEGSYTYHNFSFNHIPRLDLGDAVWDDAMRIFPDEDMWVVYDYNAEPDGTESWDTGQYGDKPYGFLMSKVLRDFSKTTSPGDFQRHTLLKGIATNNTGIGIFLGLEYNTLVAGKDSGIQLMAVQSYSGIDGEEFTNNPNFSGVIEGESQYDWVTGLAGTGDLSVWEMLTGGFTCDLWEPAVVGNPSKNVYGGNRPGNSTHSTAWVIDQLAPGESARVVFSQSWVDQDSWEFANGSFPTVEEDLTDVFDKSQALEELYNNNMNPALTPIVPNITRKTGYSEFTDLEDFNNREIQVEWTPNAETVKLPAQQAKYYRIQQNDGEKYKTIVRFEGVYNRIPDLVDDYDPAEGESTELQQHVRLDDQGEEEIKNPNVLWMKDGFRISLIPLTDAGVLDQDSSEFYDIGLRFEDGDNPSQENFVGYVFYLRGKTFGYEYNFHLQAMNDAGFASSVTGDGSFAISPEANPATSGIGEVKVVPNPLFVGSQMDKKTDYSFVKFNHLPGECTIKIYDAMGRKLRELKHDDGSTSHKWFLLTKYNQQVAPGIYLYVVESGSEKQKGTFSIVR